MNRISDHLRIPQDLLPNGYTRQEYYQAGFLDFDIEYLGLDQPRAPGPLAAGEILVGMLKEDWENRGNGSSLPGGLDLR